MTNVTNFKKHGYFHGIKDLDWQSALEIFCRRRSGDIRKDFGSTLSFDDLLARIYLQGVMDGNDMYEKTND